MMGDSGANLTLTEDDIQRMDFRALDEVLEDRNNTGEYVPPPPSFYKYQPAPETLQDAMIEIDYMRKRLVRRMEIIDAVRRAYLKDVVTVRMEHLKLLDEYNQREAQVALGLEPTSQRSFVPQLDKTPSDSTAPKKALVPRDSASVMSGGYYSVSENLHHNVPSLDMRHFLPLHAPAESYLLVKRCPACGGHLEVIKHESKKIKRLTKEVEAFKESEKRAQGREKRLKAQIQDAELKLSEQMAKNKIDQEIMNRKVMELKVLLKTKVDREDLDKVHAKVRAEKKKYDNVLKELDVIPQLRAQIIEHEEQVKRLETEVHRDKFNIKTVKQEKKSVEVQLKSVLDEMRTTEKKLKVTKKELTQTVEERELLKIQLEETKARVAKLEAHITQTTQADSSNQMQLMNLEAEMRDQLEAEELRNEELDEKLSEAKSQIRKLMQQVASLNGGKMPDLPNIGAGEAQRSKKSSMIEEMFAMEAADAGDQSMRPGSPDQQGGGGRRTRRRRRDRKRGTLKATGEEDSPDRKSDDKADGFQMTSPGRSSPGRSSPGRRHRERSMEAGATGTRSRQSTSPDIYAKDEEIEALKKEVKAATEKVDEEVKAGATLAPKSVKTQLKKMRILMKTYDRKFKTEKKGQVHLQERIMLMERELETRRQETNKLMSLIDPDVLEKNKTFIMDYGARDSQDISYDEPGESGSKVKPMFIPYGRGGSPSQDGESAKRNSSFVARAFQLLSQAQKDALQKGEPLFTIQELETSVAEKEEELQKEYEDQCAVFQEQIQVITEEKKRAEEEGRDLRRQLMEKGNEIDGLREEMDRLRSKFASENSSTNLVAQKMANDVGSLRMEYEIATVALDKAKADVKTMRDKLEQVEKYAKKLKHELKMEQDNKQATLDKAAEKSKALARLMIFLQRATHRIHDVCTHTRPKTSDKNRTIEVIQVDKIMRLVQQNEEGNGNDARAEEVRTMLGEQSIEALSEYAEDLTQQAIFHVEMDIKELLDQKEEQRARLTAELEHKSKVYEDKIIKLEKALTNANSEMEKMKRATLTEVGTLKEQAERYKKTIADLEAAMSMSQTQLLMVEELKKKAMAQQKEIFQKKKRIEELERKVKDLEYDNDELDCDLHNTKTDLERMTEERDRLVIELEESERKAADYKQQFETTKRRLTEILEADKQRLATNVSIALEVKPNHFTHDKQIQTEFVTPEMTLRQVNHYHKYPFQSTGAPFVKPQVKNAEPPLWALRSEFGTTSAGAPKRKVFSQERPWTDGSVFGKRVSANQEQSLFTEFDYYGDANRPFTAQYPSEETERANFFGLDTTNRIVTHSHSTGTMESSLTEGKFGPEISLPMVQRHSSKILADGQSYNPPSPQLPRLSR